MRIVHTLIPALGLLAACASTHVVSTPAPLRTGDTVRYAFRSDHPDFVQARAVSLTADTLVFERSLVGEPGRWVPGQLPTDSLARLEVHVGRHGNALKGGLIGGLAGFALGAWCAASYDEDAFMSPTPGECFLAFTLTGGSVGLLFGALKHTDVWAPVIMPGREPAPAAVSFAPTGVGLRIPFRAGGP